MALLAIGEARLTVNLLLPDVCTPSPVRPSTR